MFIAQLFTLCQLPEYNQYFPEGEGLNRDRLFTLFRFAFEEQMRRSIKDGVEPFTKHQVLKILFPDAMSVADELFKIREKQIVKSAQADGDGSMSAYKHQADMLRQLDPNADLLDP